MRTHNLHKNITLERHIGKYFISSEFCGKRKLCVYVSGVGGWGGRLYNLQDSMQDENWNQNQVDEIGTSC